MYYKSNTTIFNNKYTFMLTDIYHNAILYNSTLIQITLSHQTTYT
nr:MAG TPA: hypothetical protein [Caudoviricetes sp.]